MTDNIGSAIGELWLRIFAARLTELRHGEGLSVREMARALSVDHSTVSRMERGHTLLSDDLEHRYRAVFGDVVIDEVIE